MQAVAGSLVAAVAAVNASFSNRLDSFSGQVTALNTTVSSVAVAFNALPAPIRDGSLVATVAAVNASVNAVSASVQTVNASVQALSGTVAAVVNATMREMSALQSALNASRISYDRYDFSVNRSAFPVGVGYLQMYQLPPTAGSCMIFLTMNLNVRGNSMCVFYVQAVSSGPGGAQNVNFIIDNTVLPQEVPHSVFVEFYSTSNCWLNLTAFTGGRDGSCFDVAAAVVHVVHTGAQ